MTSGRRIAVWLLAAATAWMLPTRAAAQAPQTPAQFFGFEIGTDGELARYPRVLAYLRHLADRSDRVQYDVRGTTTEGHPYVLLTVSSKANLDRLDRLMAINHRLSDPRITPPDDARRLAREGVPFYFLYATIHSTEIGNGQAIVTIAHRLATDETPAIRHILDNAVVLIVPSQNPDGQIKVVDHWYATQGTPYDRIYPDLYHRYAGHDANRDWFMFSLRETRLAIDIHREFRPHVTHDMHQMGATGARIFVPPFQQPHDPNIHPLLIDGQNRIGAAMASALAAAGKTGVVQGEQYDLWTPARQYMVYHGQPRILTEIASAHLADPFVNPRGPDRPLGPQTPRENFPTPYDRGVWRLRDIVEYGEVAVFAGLRQVAAHRIRWLEDFYTVHRDWVERDEAPRAFVIPAAQHDPFETYELLERLQLGDVEIERARAPFTADGRRYAAGSWIVPLAQPYGAFAKTLLERQTYPDRRRTPGDMPLPPYDVTAHTLGLLMGVDVVEVSAPITADTERLAAIEPPPASLPPPPGWAYVCSPTTNAAFMAVSALQAADVPVFRAAESIRVGDATIPPGAWIVPSSRAARRVLETMATTLGLTVDALDHPPAVAGFQLEAAPRVGLWRIPNLPAAGWMQWLLDQYGVPHRVVSSGDVGPDLRRRYDVIILPSGTSYGDIVHGLDPRRHDASWRWAYGVGADGWDQLREWVAGGGTLIAVGTAVETARSLVHLPIAPVLPQPVDLPSTRFYAPGSLIAQAHDTTHPIGFGMPARWPVFLYHNQAYRRTGAPDVPSEVVSRYPDATDLLASGWLLGGDQLRNRANVVSFEVGAGQIVTLGSDVAFRGQTRATFKLLFNAIYQSTATHIDAAAIARLGTLDGD